MIPGSAVYHVVEAMAPLYTATALGYASVRWFKAFSPEQCAGINHFVALYAVPLLIFRMVSANNPYAMNGRLIAADTLQKSVILLALMAWAFWSNRRRSRSQEQGATDTGKAVSASPLQWLVTIFSVATLPNTIIMGVPLLDGMYGAASGSLMAQIVVMQFCIWYNVVIFLYEYMAARRSTALAHSGSSKISRVLPATATIGGDGNGISASPLAPDVSIQIQDTELTAVTSRVQDIEAGETVVAKDENLGDGKVVAEEEKQYEEVSPAPSVKCVIWMAGKKLLKIPNTYASFLGLLWALIAFKCGIKMPKIIDNSLYIISTTAVGLSMFATGTFMARQSRLIPCGYKVASLSMVIKFLIGPVVMAVASLVIGMHGTLLHVAIVQAALPLAVTSFVYAEEYKLHPDIMSTGVIFGIFLSAPITIVYYILLGL